MGTARWRERLGAVILASSSALLVLLVGEAVLWGLGWPSVQPAAARMVDARWRLCLDCYPSNPRSTFPIDLRTSESQALYRHVAPLRYDKVAARLPFAVLTRYNRLRLREVEPTPKPKGVLRVAIVGDSFAEGQGVNAQGTCAPVLGRLLEPHIPGRIEVLNCGQRGKDLPDLLETVDAALAYRPDLVVYALVLNDAVRPESFRARQSYVNDWILDRGRPEDEGEAVRRWRPRLFDFVGGRIQAWRVGQETERWYRQMWRERDNPEGWNLTWEAIGAADRRCREAEARFLVAPWPLLVGLEGRYPFEEAHTAIARECLARGIAHNDLLRAFRGRRTAELFVHPVDHHPNEIGHRIAAEALVEPTLRLLGVD